QASALSWQSRT
ncbi:putative outer membrane domain protein, partial [Vibrio parahaemolyticus V-223/04]